MFSLAGIPPLFGFWAKFLVFDAAVGAGLSALAAIGIAASVISAFYYLKIVKTIYIDDPAPEYARAGSVVENGIITICAAIIVLGYLLNPVLDRSEEHTSELQSLMRISYAVFCLKKKKN